MGKFSIRAMLLAVVILFGFGLHAATPSISWPGSISVNGTQLILQGQDTANPTGGTTLEFDYNNDGTAEVSVDTDEQGKFTAALSTVSITTLHVRATDGVNTTSWTSITLAKNTTPVRANAVPSVVGGNVNPQICTCTQNCGSSGVFSPNAFTRSFEATSHGVNLVDGTVITSIPVMGFGTRMLGFNMTAYHHSLMNYSGPLGESASHTWNFFVVQTSSTEATFVTPDLRMFPTTQDAGEDWHYVSGFLGTVKRDASLGRWIFTHHTGVVYEFMIAPNNLPGYLYRIYEPNGNQTTLSYFYDGRLSKVTTDLGQEVTFAYSGEVLNSMTDPLTRVFNFVRDGSSRLITVQLPSTWGVDVAEGSLDTTDSLSGSNAARDVTLVYTDGDFPNHITEIEDARGSTLAEYAYDSTYGRVATKTITGTAVTFYYHADQFTSYSGSAGQEYGGSPDSSPTAGPEALAMLDSNNRVTRVKDRMGYFVDYEMHTSGGGPLNSKGRWGLRREIRWTVSGAGGTALRAGEPDYYEKRWLHDCNCLSGKYITDWFDSVQAAAISTNHDMEIPDLLPKEEFTYNNNDYNRQVTMYRKLGAGGEEIKWEKEYDTFANFSRLLKHWTPQEYDGHALYSGAAAHTYRHLYTYDANGNLATHTLPAVIYPTSQSAAVRTWDYNIFGQLESYEDENGNITYYVYNSSSSSASTYINAQETFEGYLYSVTTGYTGSSDGNLNLTTYNYTNMIGMRTQTQDPLGHYYSTEYFMAGDVSLTTTPSVTHYDSGSSTYQTKYFYDRAGHRIRTEQKNIDVDGTSYANAWIKTSTSFNAIGQPLKVSREVDSTSGNDLVTEYYYNANDQRTISMSPLGTRSFTTYDERGQVLRSFSGVSAPTAGIAESYPALTADSLTGATAISRTFYTYDARGLTTSVKDGRDKIHTTFYDFAGRAVASRDPNGNGSVTTYDDAGQVITSESGVVNSSGVLTSTLSRSYRRYDERGRAYLSAQDSNLGNDESTDTNPTASSTNPVYTTYFDQAGRVTKSRDALTNDTLYTYDSVNRRLTVTDAMAGVSAANVTTYTYDANGNVLTVSEAEKLDTGSTDGMYLTMYEYDEINRQIRVRQRGKDLGSSTYSHDISSYTYYDSSSYVRLSQDAEDRWSQSFRDDLGRTLRVSRYDGDPLHTTPGAELMRNDFTYDENSRKLKDIAYSDLGNLSTSKQETLYAYDDAGRLIRTVYPDSDDPIDGSGNGTDTIYDRVEIEYDATSNVIETTDQRGVEIDNTYDDAGRLTQQDITLVGAVGGETKRVFVYDALGRFTQADNNYARIQRAFNALGRLTTETTRIKPIGTGFTAGWDYPMEVSMGYDLNGNRLQTTVNKTGSAEELEIDRTYDDLGRLKTVDAEYFHVTKHRIADYNYVGKWRVYSKTLGESNPSHDQYNQSQLNVTYDGLRRISDYTWRNDDDQILTGHAYAYDDVGNLLNEKWHHDRSRFDNFNYDSLGRITDVRYRDASALDYRTASGGSWTAGGAIKEGFAYDDSSNRTTATQQDVYGGDAAFNDTYTINAANEYTQINRASSNTDPLYDATGNMTRFPVIPGAGAEAGNKVNAVAQYDAFNQMISATAGSNNPWAFNYDALGRRIVEWDASGGPDFVGTRFIHEGYSVIMERKFTSYVIGEYPDQETIYPSTDDAHSKPHKIFVRGSILFSAVDGDLDSYIGADDGEDQSTVNLPEFDYDSEAESGEAAVEDRLDFAYYYLDDARGRVMALLARDIEVEVTHPATEGGPEPEANDLSRILEYYTYNAFGTVTALPVQDRAEASYPGVDGSGDYNATGAYPGSGSLGQWDRMEDTPLDLSDNATLMLNRRNGDNNHVASGQHYGRESAWANQMVSSGRRWVSEVGVEFCPYPNMAPFGGLFGNGGEIQEDVDVPSLGSGLDSIRKLSKWYNCDTDCESKHPAGSAELKDCKDKCWSEYVASVGGEYDTIGVVTDMDLKGKARARRSLRSWVNRNKPKEDDPFFKWGFHEPNPGSFDDLVDGLKGRRAKRLIVWGHGNSDAGLWLGDDQLYSIDEERLKQLRKRVWGVLIICSCHSGNNSEKLCSFATRLGVRTCGCVGNCTEGAGLSANACHCKKFRCCRPGAGVPEDDMETHP